MARQMKDSGVEWIGEMPENWSLFKLKNIINFQNGFAFDSSKLSNNGKYPVIKIGDICNGSIDIYNANKINDNSGLENYLIKEKDILLAMSGATVGKLGYVSNIDKECYINQRVGIIRTSKSKYVYYYLNTDEFLKYILLLSAGSAQPNISTENINNYYISLPNDIEQQRIVDFLDEKVAKIDSVIEKTKATIEDYKKYKQSIITETVTKGLNPNVEMKDSGIDWLGEITKDFVICKIKNVTSLVTDGAHITPDTSEEVYRFVSVTDMNEYGNINWKNCLFITEEQYKYFVKTGCKPKNKDVLISKDGTIGKTTIVNTNKDFVIASSLVIMRPQEEKLSSEYLQYCLMSSFVQEQLNSLLSGSALKRVSVAKNANLKIVYTSDKDVQKKIVEYLDHKCSEIDKLIIKKEELIKELENYKKSLIYECVTGKREV